MENDARKAYVPPTVTDLGDARKKTKGLWGEVWEVYGRVHRDVTDPPDDPPGNGNT